MIVLVHSQLSAYLGSQCAQTCPFSLVHLHAENASRGRKLKNPVPVRLRIIQRDLCGERQNASNIRIRVRIKAD